MPDQELERRLQPVWDGAQPVTAVDRDNGDGQPEAMAEGYEVRVALTGTVAGQSVVWNERRLVIRSLKPAHTTETAVRTRLAQAQTGLAGLNTRKKGKPRFIDAAAVRHAVATVLRRPRVTGLVTVTIEERVQARSVRAYRGRPAAVRVARDW